MYDKLFDGIPDYVRITIFSCVRKLSTFANFNNHEDIQDLVQELLLFYIEHFYQREIPSDAYVVASLQNYAKKLLKTKMREPFGLFVYLDDEEEYLSISSEDNYEQSELKALVKKAEQKLSPREILVLDMILEDKTLEEITHKIHISKNTIYKIFEKLKKSLKK
ncbi:MAG TPA: sigma-70 family RNA polymerase sigma factor [Candidatus Scatocola faecipullorum]|uniref:Sigma-70 family RNA polymerase sigma factor n=1 Tax=Candidatus Scatocola faecipullorum TaxID=2840917 RepID=A0A9D1M335_9PROT|nr:sigma-70 family RNA polymerase sigma factor [Candidatus Scatocola faecipullorum]